MGKGIRFRPEEYYEASHEKLQTAMHLHEQGKYPCAMYFFGVSVECILRAYITAKSPEFDEKHVLPRLFISSGIERLVSEKNRKKIGAALGDIWARWKNDFRYASRRKVEGFMHKANLARYKGDFLKENSRIMRDAASIIVVKGMAKWTTKS